MKKIYLTLLVSAVFLFSCNKEGEFFNDGSDRKTEEAPSTRSTEDASDPFAVDAMQRALDMLAADNPEIASITLRPTHYYVKFNPQDSIQMDRLEELGIELFSHPLDNKTYAEAEPDEVTEDTPLVYEPLYSVVPVDFVFPEGVDYEIIHGSVIQHKDGAAPAGEEQLSPELYSAVLGSSMVLTGNAPVSRAASRGTFEASARVRYVISGEYYSLPADTLPLVGAKVRAYYYSFVRIATTDRNGETGVICTTDTPIHYEILWQDAMWTLYIASKNQVRTTDLGVSEDGIIDAVLQTGTWEGVLAGAHTALYSYFYGNYPLTYGLKKPGKCIKIATMNKYGRSNTVPIRPRREIFYYGKKQKNSTLYYQSEEAMSTMFHELGHISHNRLNDFNYSFVAHSKYGESWATGVEYAYMQSLFPEYEYTYYSGDGDGWMYKHVVQGMLKNGFTMQEIQHGFNAAASSGWDGWHKAMKENVVDKWTDRSEEEKAEMRQIVDVIFNNPVDVTLDIRDIVEASAEKIYIHQPVRFKLNKDASKLRSKSDRLLSIEEWEIVDSDGVEVPHQFMDNSLFVYFTKPGRKTVRMKAKVFQTERTYEKTVYVRSEDIIVPETEPIVGRDIKFVLQPSLVEAQVKTQRWKSGDSKTKLVSFNTQRGTFRFDEKGERTVNVSVYYPELQESVDYAMKTLVRDPESDEIFYILNPPELFDYDTTYRAMYGVVGETITEIERIECDHCHFLFYLYFDDSWSFDKNSGVLSFSIPKHNAYMDYVLTLFYRVDNSDELKKAWLFVSNYR